MVRKTVLGFLFAIFCLSVSSQGVGKLSGYLYDAVSNLPVENVTVKISGGDYHAVSDKRGFFEIAGIPPGEYKLLVRHISYAYAEERVALAAGKAVNLNIYLDPATASLQEVVIRDTGPSGRIISRLPYVETNFTREQMDNDATRDVTDYLRSSRNINGIRKGGTQLDPVVRGFKFSQLNVQINSGQKVEGGCPNRMDPATAHVEIEDLQSIEVLKGPFALRYGPMFGGLINLNTEMPPHTDSTCVHVNASLAYESNWNGIKEHLGVYGGYKWFYYNFSGGRKDYGNYEDGNGNEVKSAFRKYNYKGQLGFTPFKNHSVSFNFEESKGRDIRFPTLPMDERKDDTRLLSVDYLGTGISPGIEFIRFKLYNSDVRHEMDNKYRPFSDTVVAVSVIDAINSGARLETGFNLAGGSLKGGLDYENISKDGERVKNMIMQPGLPVKKEMLWNSARIMNLGIFAEYTYSIDAWEFVGSARLDMNSAVSDDIIIQHPMQGEIYHYGQDSIESDFTNLSVSLGTTRKLNANLALSLALGRGVRSPDMTERFIILLPIGYDKFDYLGNPLLEPEINNQADLTLKFTHEKTGLLQVNGFYSLVNNFITGRRLPPSEQKPLTTDVLGVKQFYNAGNARLTGFEVSWASPARHALGASVFASYTYGTIDEALVFTVDENGNVTGDEELQNDALSEIPPLEATVNLYYRMFHDILVPRFSLRMVNAQNHVSSAFYEKTSPGFVLASLSISYAFNDNLSMAGGVNNLFDVAYYEHLNRNIIGSTMDLYEPGRSFYINLFFRL